MATPTAICPVCFVRFPVPERSSTPTSCPACANKFAAPVQEADDEPKPAAKAKPKPKLGEKVKPAKPAKAAPLAKRAPEPDELADDDFDDEPRPKKKPAKARTGFRKKGDDGEGREPEESMWSNPLALAAIIGGGFAVLAIAIVLLIYGLSPADPDGDLANLPPAPKPAPQPQPNPWNNPFPNPNPLPPDGPEPDPFPPGPDPFDPPIRLPQPPLFPNVPNPPVFPPVQPKPPEKPKDKLKLPAVAPVAMKAAPLTEDSTEVKLPGTVKDACVGGGGRYFCLYLADKKQVAVFDVCEAKVAKYLPVAGAGALLAANMNKLLVVFPDEGLVVRYDLGTFEKEATLKLPFDGKVKAVAMGSASAGPLLIQHQIGNDALGSAPVSYLDPIKLTEFDLPTGAGGRGHASIRDAMHFRASPDGLTFGVWATSHSPTGLGSTVLTDGEAKHYYEHDSVGHVVPGPDGTLFTASGRYTAALKKKGDARGRGFGLTLPAVSGGLYFTLGPDGKGDDPFGGFPRPGQEPGKMKADIKMDGDERSLVTLKDIPGAAADVWNAGDFTADKRYLLVPDAKAFVALAGTNDKLIVRKFDLLASMDAAGIDYLFVASRPGGVKPGTPLDYQIEVKSKKGGVTFNLDSGPEGLKVSATGRVTWAVPNGYTGGETVVITVSDKSGQQAFHTFELKEGPAAALPPTLPPIDGPKPPVIVPFPPKGNPDPKPPVAVVPKPKANPDQVVIPPAKPFDTPRTKLTAKTAVPLPDSADAVCLGGGGRFLLLRIPKVKQLAILDLCEGKVVKLLPLAEGNAAFAAGMSHVFVYNPSADVFQRWSLETFEKEATVKNPVGGSPKKLLMGHSTDGPLCLTAGATFTFLGATTFKQIDLKPENAGGGFARFGREGAIVRVSGDGRVYGWYDDNVSPQGFNSLVIDGKSAKAYHQHMTPWVVVPGPDGKLFTGQGIHTPEQKPIGGKAFADTYPNPVRVPATADPWYVRITYGGQSVPGKSDYSKQEFAVGLVNDADFALPLSDHDGFAFPAQAPHPAHIGRGTPFHDADRVVFNPRAGVLAIIGNADNKVHLHPLDPKALLAKSTKDYLMVMSKPAAAEVGKKWSYTPDVWSKSGKAVLKVESGPKGMTASGGSVSWDVPKDYTDGPAQVILTVSDGGKQEAFHTFDLPVTGGK